MTTVCFVVGKNKYIIRVQDLESQKYRFRATKYYLVASQLLR